MRGLLVALLLAGCTIDPFTLGGGDGDGDGDGDASSGDGGAAIDAGCVPVGVDDQCDEIDNDCNGTVDDGFDKQTDDENCGTCGVRCTAPGAILDCQDAMCEFIDCLPGFADLDSQASGCEYVCPLFPAQPEQCNGVDDDCDGVADEPAELPPPPAGQCRITADTPCEGTSMICATRGAPPVTRWYCDYDPAVEFDPTIPNGILLEETLCDGEDGDCDTVADDPFPDLGQECDNGLLGACRDAGARVCDPLDAAQTVCDLSLPPDPVGGPNPETCNGVDDDCNGTVDDTSGPDRVLDDMVHVSFGGNDFWIYRYEASRPDATDGSGGSGAARACSNPDVLPWHSINFASAQAACAAAGGGKRLCTDAEYQAACAGAADNTYPYGDPFEPDSCNAEPFDGISGGGDDDILLPTGDPALAMCTSDDGVHDLSGNLKEWTDDITGQTGNGVDIAVLRGGAYTTPAGGATCAFRSSRAPVNAILPAVGFRCCNSTGP